MRYLERLLEYVLYISRLNLVRMLSGFCVGRMSCCGPIKQAACCCYCVSFSQGVANFRVLLYSVAAEVAAAKPEVSGPGTFMTAFVDEIHRLSAGDYKWIEKGKLSLWHGDE